MEGLENKVTTGQAAELLKCTDRHVRHLIEVDAIVAVPWGRDWIIDRPSVEAYAATDRKRGPKPKPKDE